MGGSNLPGALGLRSSIARQPAGPEPASGPAGCPLDCLAAVLSSLLGRDVPPAQVLERAVALGLLRYPGSPAPVLLPLQTAARLLLAGYRLPAHAGEGSLTALAAHVRARRRVFVLLGSGPDPFTGNAVAAFQVAGESPPDPAGPALTLLPVSPAASLLQLPLDEFQQAWLLTGHVLIVAANAWAELPARGRVFFGGGRDPDGTYYWDTAECVTDGRGHILRCG
jgi:hypothetical protein